MGLPASKFCSTVVHDRGLKKRLDGPSVIHMLFICVGDGAGLCIRGVGWSRWCCNWLLQMFVTFRSLSLGDAANTIQ